MNNLFLKTIDDSASSENTTITNDLKQALDEVTASSMAGAPFLIAYGITFGLTGILSYFLAQEFIALLAMFQGVAALPFAFWLERRLAQGRLSNENPLKKLSALLAVSQALALPLLIATYSVEPGIIPLALAALGGVHFLPYAWLQRTSLYSYLAGVVSLGAFGLQLMFPATAFHVIFIYVAFVYGITAVFVYRHAQAILLRHK